MLKFYGGKNDRKIGSWVASQLPPPTGNQLYVEPFAGMLGVLLRRHPAGVEVVNDLDGRIINFWRAVKDAPDELADRIDATPYSRTEYLAAISLNKLAAKQHLTDLPKPDITAAAALAVILEQGRQPYIDGNQ